jgi:hypothetical protein
MTACKLLLAPPRFIQFCDECDFIDTKVNRRSGHTVEVVPCCHNGRKRKLGEDGAIRIVPPAWCPLPSAE